MNVSLHYQKLQLILFLGFISGNIVSQQGVDQVNGNLIQFNNNGAWCWFQDERVVIDTIRGKLIVGSVASGSGTDGPTRNGSVEAVIFDLATRVPSRYVLTQWKEDCDDHNTPGFLIRPDGKYLAMYARHYDRYLSHYRIFDNNQWEPEHAFDWTGIPGGTDYTIAYSNLYYLSSEGKTYNFARANHRSPNLICSDNLGDSWIFGGQLTTNSSKTYNKGYYKYWSNGVDRIDFLFTEQHPRDTSTSIYHGFIKNGKSYDTNGTIIDDDIFDTIHIPTFHDFTRVFADSTDIAGSAMRRCWIADMTGYKDGTLAAIVTARINNNEGGNSKNINPNHAFIYCRYDGKDWSWNYLCKAGLKMYSTEQDYTGLGALCPDDPSTIYLSTTYDPRDDKTKLDVHEIFKGKTRDGGKSWIWTPVTINSGHDNFRPVVPRWDGKHVALLWWRGTYNSAQNYDAAVVGIIDSRDESSKLMTHVSMTSRNTKISKGSESGQNSDNKSLLVTEIKLTDPGTYDIWINFRGNKGTDCRIEAGLKPGEMQTFRQMACKNVESVAHTQQAYMGKDTLLYQAYLGRIRISGDKTIKVYMDNSIYPDNKFSETGDVSFQKRYEGISYSKIDFEDPR